jgi:ElaB/YqjD/DUF883 family membrane-anchored ribosome-binding protein
MMKDSAVEFNRAKSKMASDLNAAITDGEDMLKAAAAISGHGLAAARTKLAGAFQPAVDKARQTADAADTYVHASPWTVIGVAAAAGILIGFLVARR